jgi:hypothetical protein
VQIWRQEQVLDILRNVTTNPPDRVKEFTFKANQRHRHSTLGQISPAAFERRATHAA